MPKARRTFFLRTYSGYGDRDKFCEAIGFASYQEYLTSDLWRFVTDGLAKTGHGRRCLACGSRVGLAWHHRTYSLAALVGNFTDGDCLIVRLCTACHKAIHYRGSDFVLSMEQTDMALARLMVAKHRGEQIDDLHAEPDTHAVFDSYNEHGSEEYYEDF
jgi:hypothetical protein